MKNWLYILYITLFLTFVESAYCDNSRELTQYEQGVLGLLYSDYSKAVTALRPLAEGGDARAARLIGGMHQYGIGIEKDTGEARKWYHLALKFNNYSVAKNSIGLTYMDDGDEDRAMEWFLKAANDGDAYAFHNIALQYMKHNNYQDAVKWYQKAVDKNYRSSQHNLALLYKKGIGVKKDTVKALHLFDKAAHQNVSYSQYNLASFYFNASHSKSEKLMARRDEFQAKAYVWMSLANINGLEPAYEALVKIKAEMSAETIAHADKLLKEKAVVVYGAVSKELQELTGTSESFIAEIYSDRPERLLPLFRKLGILQ